MPCRARFFNLNHFYSAQNFEVLGDSRVAD